MRGKDVQQDCYVAREALLLGVSLTLDPANLDAKPLRWRAGDLRDAGVRRSWPITTASADPLLGRAIEHCSPRELRHRSATRIVDLRDGGSNPFGLRPAPYSWETRALPGGLRRSAHVGRVLRVS
jgi:hypothetical protein